MLTPAASPRSVFSLRLLRLQPQLGYFWWGCYLTQLVGSLGLLASIAMTFATQGRALLAACTFGGPERLALAPDCPFDPTRIYVSA